MPAVVTLPKSSERAGSRHFLRIESLRRPFRAGQILN